MKRLLAASLCCMVLFGYSGSLHAQALIDDTVNPLVQVSPNDIEVVLDPEFPDAFQDVRVRVRSNTVDLNRYTISWSNNGSIVQSGIGKREYQFTTGAYGDRTLISIVIQTPSGPVQKDIAITPEDLTLLWEAVDAYVPPFYKGKKLPGKESIVRAIAIPNFVEKNGVSVAPQGAVYVWKRNYEVLTQASGFGKDSILIKHNRIRPKETVSVTASDRGGARSASQAIDIKPYEPEVVFYEKDATTGLKRALRSGKMFLMGTEATLVAEPYFISTLTNSLADVAFAWAVNNTSIGLTDEARKNELVIKKPSGEGISIFSVSVEGNKEYPLQKVTGDVEVSF